MKEKVEIKTEYWSNGSMWHETPHVNGNVHGLEKHWYKNGNNRWEIPYKKDQQHGAKIWFNY